MSMMGAVLVVWCDALVVSRDGDVVVGLREEER
jgi:hypothetical protein